MPSTQLLLFAFLGGYIPALLWLWFFLKEDIRNPEPRWLIVASFLSGILAVLIALPAEMVLKCAANGTWPHNTHLLQTIRFCGELPGVNPIFLWAAAEELIKYFIVVIVILWREAVDEPIDAMIYLITVALGFAAFETGLFLLEPFGRGDVVGGILTGNLRFLGAALIHTLSSAVVGFSIALTFYKSYIMQFISLCTGLLAAIILHALFNHHIIINSGNRTVFVFFFVWTGIVILLLLFERAKLITRSFR